MRENTNRAIAINSIILYVRMGITTICALLTTRFALQALGIVDFGLYTVLGGIISFVSIFNTIMLSTSNRFIAVAIGKGVIEEANKQFNVNLVVHVIIAILAIIVAVPIGDWYIPKYVNYDGPLSNAMMVYLVSVIGCVFSFIGVPYNGLLMAKEKFIVFSLTDIIIHIIKLVISWLLIYYFTDKLFIYTVSMAILTGISSIIFFVYCKRTYPEIVRLKVVKDSSLYKNVFGFSAWVAVGAVAMVGKNQGAALIVNIFFNTILNTSLGLASSVNSYVSMFGNNVVQPMQPQITKSYASGNLQRTEELLIMSTKYSFMLVLLVGALFLVEPGWILGLWLGDVPPMASIFLVLFVIDTIVQSLNLGVVNIIWASGQIKMFQIIVSGLNLLSIVLGYFVLKFGSPAYYLLVAYIIISLIKFFAIQWTLKHTLHYDNKILWLKSYIPSLLIVFLFIPMFFVSLLPVVHLSVSFVYLCILEWFIGFDKKERLQFVGMLKSKLIK